MQDEESANDNCGKLYFMWVCDDKNEFCKVAKMNFYIKKALR